ncbi:MAG: hypothetical protein ACOX4G_08710 [Limnochordia bacterium]|jgi:hypothetical protein
MGYDAQPPHPPRKVAIVGGARSRTQAPYEDHSWEIWAFSSLRLPTPRITRWFEMHALEDLQGQLQRNTKRRLSYRSYLRFLQNLDCPIYMQTAHGTIPKSVEYPLQEALDALGRCFTSTASYLIALAILEAYETIGVWGIHLTERTVYAHQRPGVEYLLGVARTKGTEVYLPPGCPLRIPIPPILTVTDVLYGYDWQSPRAWWRRRRRRRKRR